MFAITLHDGRIVRLHGYQAYLTKIELPAFPSLAEYKKPAASDIHPPLTRQIDRLTHPWGSIICHICWAAPKIVSESGRTLIRCPEWINLSWLKSAPIHASTIPGRKRVGAGGSELVIAWFTQSAPDAHRIAESVRGLLKDSSWEQMAQDYVD